MSDLLLLLLLSIFSVGSYITQCSSLKKITTGNEVKKVRQENSLRVILLVQVKQIAGLKSPPPHPHPYSPQTRCAETLKTTQLHWSNVIMWPQTQRSTEWTTSTTFADTAESAFCSIQNAPTQFIPTRGYLLNNVDAKSAPHHTDNQFLICVTKRETALALDLM